MSDNISIDSDFDTMAYNFTSSGVSDFDRGSIQLFAAIMLQWWTDINDKNPHNDLERRQAVNWVRTRNFRQDCELLGINQDNLIRLLRNKGLL
ncbi:MAG: hypothetical protein WCL30_03890 [Pseudomonadota bacterium]